MGDNGGIPHNGGVDDDNPIDGGGFVENLARREDEGGNIQGAVMDATMAHRSRHRQAFYGEHGIIIDVASAESPRQQIRNQAPATRIGRKILSCEQYDFYVRCLLAKQANDGGVSVRALRQENPNRYRCAVAHAHLSTIPISAGMEPGEEFVVYKDVKASSSNIALDEYLLSNQDEESSEDESSDPAESSVTSESTPPGKRKRKNKDKKKKKKEKKKRIRMRFVNTANVFDIAVQHHQHHVGINSNNEAIKAARIFITEQTVREICRTCPTCSTGLQVAVVPHVGAVRAIESSEYRDRFQVDLIDMSHDPKPDKYGITMKYILHCRDHFIGYSWLYPIPNKTARCAAEVLVEHFCQWGYPIVLQTDNGGEFTGAELVNEIHDLFPDIVLVNGRPRTPRDQGAVERANQVVKRILRALQEHWRQLNGANGRPLGIDQVDSWVRLLKFVQPIVNGMTTRVRTVSAYQHIFNMRYQRNHSDRPIHELAQVRDVRELNELVGLREFTDRMIVNGQLGPEDVAPVEEHLEEDEDYGLEGFIIGSMNNDGSEADNLHHLGDEDEQLQMAIARSMDDQGGHEDNESGDDAFYYSDDDEYDSKMPAVENSQGTADCHGNIGDVAMNLSTKLDEAHKEQSMFQEHSDSEASVAKEVFPKTTIPLAQSVASSQPEIQQEQEDTRASKSISTKKMETQETGNPDDSPPVSSDSSNSSSDNDPTLSDIEMENMRKKLAYWVKQKRERRLKKSVTKVGITGRRTTKHATTSSQSVRARRSSDITSIANRKGDECITSERVESTSMPDVVPGEPIFSPSVLSEISTTPAAGRREVIDITDDMGSPRSSVATVAEPIQMPDPSDSTGWESVTYDDYFEFGESWRDDCSWKSPQTLFGGEPFIAKRVYFQCYFCKHQENVYCSSAMVNSDATRSPPPPKIYHYGKTEAVPLSLVSASALDKMSTSNDLGIREYADTFAYLLAHQLHNADVLFVCPNDCSLLSKRGKQRVLNCAQVKFIAYNSAHYAAVTISMANRAIIVEDGYFSSLKNYWEFDIKRVLDYLGGRRRYKLKYFDEHPCIDVNDIAHIDTSDEGDNVWVVYHGTCMKQKSVHECMFLAMWNMVKPFKQFLAEVRSYNCLSSEMSRGIITNILRKWFVKFSCRKRQLLIPIPIPEYAYLQQVHNSKCGVELLTRTTYVTQNICTTEDTSVLTLMLAFHHVLGGKKFFDETDYDTLIEGSAFESIRKVVRSTMEGHGLPKCSPSTLLDWSITLSYVLQFFRQAIKRASLPGYEVDEKAGDAVASQQQYCGTFSESHQSVLKATLNKVLEPHVFKTPDTTTFAGLMAMVFRHRNKQVYIMRCYNTTVSSFEYHVVDMEGIGQLNKCYSRSQLMRRLLSLAPEYAKWDGDKFDLYVVTPYNENIPARLTESELQLFYTELIEERESRSRNLLPVDRSRVDDAAYERKRKATEAMNKQKKKVQKTQGSHMEAQNAKVQGMSIGQIVNLTVNRNNIPKGCPVDYIQGIIAAKHGKDNSGILLATEFGVIGAADSNKVLRRHYFPQSTVKAAPRENPGGIPAVDPLRQKILSGKFNAFEAPIVTKGEYLKRKYPDQIIDTSQVCKCKSQNAVGGMCTTGRCPCKKGGRSCTNRCGCGPACCNASSSTNE